MIETLKDFPADAVAVRLSGFVSKADYDQVLVRAVERALKANERLRLYYGSPPISPASRRARCGRISGSA